MKQLERRAPDGNDQAGVNGLPPSCDHFRRNVIGDPTSYRRGLTHDGNRKGGKKREGAKEAIPPGKHLLQALKMPYPPAGDSARVEGRRGKGAVRYCLRRRQSRRSPERSNEGRTRRPSPAPTTNPQLLFGVGTRGVASVIGCGSPDNRSRREQNSRPPIRFVPRISRSAHVTKSSSKDHPVITRTLYWDRPSPGGLTPGGSFVCRREWARDLGRTVRRKSGRRLR
jgi:hypothetical protein